MAVRVTDAQVSFEGGLNLTADVAQVRSNELRQARNARLTEFGGAKLRGGTQRVHASPLASASVLGGYGWVHGDTVQQLAVCDSDLFTGTYSTSISFTNQGGTLATTGHPSFAGFRDGSADVCYIADGGALNKWDGTTLTENIAGTPGTTTQLALYNLRLFAVNGVDETLYWSALGNGDTLGNAGSGGGLAIVRTFSNQALMGLMPLGSSLLLFHKAGISRFTGWTLDDIDIDAGTAGMSADTGTIAPRSIVTAENVGYFVAERGVYGVTEGGIFPISTKINSLLRSIPKSEFHKIHAGHNKLLQEVWFNFPDLGVYCYNYTLQQWSGPWDEAHLLSTCMWSTVDTNSNPVVLFGDSRGYVIRADQPDVFVDDVDSTGGGGTTYPLELQCHRMYFDDPEGEKSLRFIYITANAVSGASAQITWESEAVSGLVDVPGGDFEVWDVGVWDEGIWPVPLTAPRRVHGWGRGTFFDFTIKDMSATEALYSRLSLEGFYTARRF